MFEYLNQPVSVTSETDFCTAMDLSLRVCVAGPVAYGGEVMDGIELEIRWSNLIGIVSEQAKALQRIAFSPIVRENHDYVTVLMDAQGNALAQCTLAIPKHRDAPKASSEA